MFICGGGGGGLTVHQGWSESLSTFNFLSVLIL